MDDHCFEFLHNSTVSFSNNPTINLTVASFRNDIIWLGNKSFMCFRPLYYKFMSQALGARLSFRFPDQDVIGQKQADEKWNGFLGLIANEQADASFVDFTYRKSRLSILKYGLFLDIGDALTIMSKESRITENSNIFIRTFQTEAWFMISFILLLCTTLTSLFTNWRRILFVLIDNLAMFWGVSIRTKANKLNPRVLTSIWLLGSMVLSMILKNEVLRSLVATKENNIHSINDMISMKINAIVIANSSQHLRILEENSKTKNKINIETITFNDIFSDKTLVKILNGTHAVIYGETSTVDLFKLNYKYPLHLSMSENQRLMSAFVMKKSLDEQIQRKINKASRIMFESGIYFQAKVHDIEYRHKILAKKSNDSYDMETLEEYESVTFHPQQNIDKFNINFVGLKLQNFGLAFWYLLFGLIFSIICFVSEFYFI